ncbi:hypothetical protein D3C72_2021320 [compost metagenome]
MGSWQQRCVLDAFRAPSGLGIVGMEDPVDERGAGAGETAKALDPNGLIGSKLKALYRAIEQEPVPDLFIDLLQKLDDAEALGRAEGKLRSKA